jgi:hypothetical protein
MSGFSVTPDQLKDIPIDKQLGDKSLTKLFEGKAAYDGKKELDTGAGKLAFSFDAEASARVDVFNSPDDKDEDGVLGAAPPKEEKEWEVKLHPQITFEAEQAWLRYRFKAGVKGSVGFKFPVGPLGAEVKVEGQKGIVFADYRPHAPAENALAAVTADVPQVRLALDPDDAFKLGRGEALSYHVYGALTASVSLSWSDAFTAGLSALSGALRSGRIIKLKLAPSFSLSFNVGVRDDFRLVFTQGRAGGVRVAVLKGHKREVGVKAGLEVGAEFADPKLVKQTLDDFWAQLTDSTVTRINNLLNRLGEVTTFEALSPAQRALANTLIERFGLGDVANTPARLKEEWEALQKRVTDRFEEVAKAKAKLGFTYEYLRVRTDETLLLAQLDAATFRKYHGELLACELSGVLGWVRENPDALERYLRQETLVRARSWGFTLGVEPWGFKLSGKDSIKQTRVVQEDIDKRQRVAYDGMRNYESDWNGTTVKWTVDFKAEMKEFSKEKAPTTCEFFYGLSLRWDWGEKSLSNDDLKRFLDHAAIWRVINRGSVGDALAALSDRVGRKADVSLEVTIDHNALRFLLPLALNPPEKLLTKGQELTGDRKIDYFGAKALAAAMAYNDTFAGRRDVKYRELLYTPLWLYYFDTDSLAVRDYELAAYNEITRNGTAVPDWRGLADREKESEKSRDTYAEMIRTYSTGLGTPGIHRNWGRFVRGLKALSEMVTREKCRPYDTVEQSFNDMAQFWGQSFYVRALGAFLMERAERSNMLGDPALKRSLTFTFGEEEAVTLGEAR